MSTLSETETNIIKEGLVLGVKVTSEKTFLTFDKENGSNDDSSPGTLGMSRRRFTTTDLVMDKELLEKVRALGTPQAGEFAGMRVLDEHSEKSTSSLSPEVNCQDLVDDLRRTSQCSQLTCDFEMSPISLNHPPQYMSLLARTPLVAPALASPISGSMEGFTTVMVRNIPNRYTQDSLIALIKSLNFRFNFFYSPIDRNSRANCGYFFVNLLTPGMAVDLLRKFEGLQLPAFRSAKVCSGCWARIQGYSANVDHYFNSPLSRLNREFRPRVFDVDGNEVSLASYPAISVEAPHSRKLFVGGLCPQTTAQTIEHHLSQFGPIEDVSIILDSASRSSRGFCFVTFENPESAKLCVETKQAHFIDGRSLGIRPYTKS